ncbi:hypothetical protein PCH_Pc18g03230 [Penicillium rubens Wisconsin 54-1255]|uniref:Uncharacterized protein n=1 Tax=Penicillium rubens (strain ATCC 28089 / DSM 1075 / NRRL 1951 / Wisconsin 54-1255) TaxID=500485 RepID=B6HB91_PENRW|nr:hypothetical protein PCH_Pc18g03230 [Penicillium rubens Wisconsin 54-1255]
MAVCVNLDRTHIEAAHDLLQLRLLLTKSVQERHNQFLTGVVAKLRTNGIDKETIFVAWATWRFDLSYLRLWLEDEKFEDILPGDENVCMRLKP